MLNPLRFGINKPSAEVTDPILLVKRCWIMLDSASEFGNEGRRSKEEKKKKGGGGGEVCVRQKDMTRVGSFARASVQCPQVEEAE